MKKVFLLSLLVLFSCSQTTPTQLSSGRYIADEGTLTMDRIRTVTMEALERVNRESEGLGINEDSVRFIDVKDAGTRFAGLKASVLEKASALREKMSGLEAKHKVLSFKTEKGEYKCMLTVYFLKGEDTNNNNLKINNCRLDGSKVRGMIKFNYEDQMIRRYKPF